MFLFQTYFKKNRTQLDVKEMTYLNITLFFHNKMLI